MRGDVITDHGVSEIKDLFKEFNFLDNYGAPVFYGKMPKEILQEFDQFTEILREEKKHRLNFLRNHVNVGFNLHQISVPVHQFERSYTWPYLIRLGEYFASLVQDRPFEDFRRKVVVRRYMGHHDNYDVWANFQNNGDENNFHTHHGTFSGVVYVENDISLPTIFEDHSYFSGQRGDIVIFPSTFHHMVEQNKTDQTRVTFAFNLEVTDVR